MDACPYIRVDEVARLTGLSVREVWRRLASDGSFPRSFKQSTRRTVWKRAEVEAWAQKQLTEWSRQAGR